MTNREAIEALGKYTHGAIYQEALSAAIAALESPRGWTPCAEGLPDNPYETCIILYKCGDAIEATTSKYLGADYGWIGFHDNGASVFAWQYVPKSWEGGLDGK